KSLGAILLGIVAAVSPAAADDIALRVAYDPASKEARLNWNGGPSPYSMFRSSSPIDLEQPSNLVGQTPLQEWSDPTPPQTILYYLVANGCDPFVPASYTSDPRFSYSCASGAFALDVTTWTLGALSDGRLTVSGTTGLPTMTGPQVPTCPTGSFSAS